jgi:hypothetical protein
MIMMKKIAIASLAFLALSACSTSQTKEEFLSSKDSMDHQSFTVEDVPFAEGKKRFFTFIAKCLKMSGTSSGYRQATFGYDYEPTVEQEGKDIVLYHHLKVTGSFDSSSQAYIFMAKIRKSTKGTLEGETYYTDPLMGISTADTSKRLIAWVKDEKKLCPRM